MQVNIPLNVFQSYIGSIFSIVTILTVLYYGLSILYWFYFLFMSFKKLSKSKPSFNPILVLFSLYNLLNKHLIHYSFNPILVLFSLGEEGEIMEFETVLSILYWFYFLPKIAHLTPLSTIDFQSYIGSIFSRFYKSVISIKTLWLNFKKCAKV